MDYVFIINPAAGKGGNQDEIAKKIRLFFKDRSEKVSIYLSKAPGDATTYGREYVIKDGSETCFVACGGDGTFYEVINGAFGRPNVCFGVYPCGSGNDFIKSVGGKKEDYLDLQNLIDGEKRVFDAINVNGHITANLCNIGIDSDICENIKKYKKIPGISGTGAYNISTATTFISSVINGMGKQMTFTFDDEEVFSGKQILSVFGNGKIYGGGFTPVPNALLDDGLIDFCTVDEVKLFDVARLIKLYKEGKHVNNPECLKHIKLKKCTGCKVHSDNELSVCLDGETFKAFDVNIKILPASLPFIVPKLSL